MCIANVVAEQVAQTGYKRIESLGLARYVPPYSGLFQHQICLTVAVPSTVR